jgi:hypothetical protein
MAGIPLLSAGPMTFAWDDGKSSVTGPLRILITNVALNSRTGTETGVRDLAIELKKTGHEPLVFSPRLGDIAREIGSCNITVTDRLGSLRRKPDVIHGNHRAPVLRALLRFPSVPAVFVCHDRLADHDRAPLVPGIQRYLAVDLNCRERVVAETGLPEHAVDVILNSVDLARFRPRPCLPASPRRALVFSNSASQESYVRPVAQACAELGIELDVVGKASENQCQNPEDLLPQYDIVFAKARAALEAMAVGCSVVLSDTHGLGCLVTSDRVAGMRPWNFGMRLLTRVPTPEAVRSEIMGYDPADAAAVQAYIRKNASLEAMARSYLDCYRAVVAQGGGPVKQVKAACRKTLLEDKQLPLRNRRPVDWLALLVRAAKEPGVYSRRLADKVLRRR